MPVVLYFPLRDILHILVEHPPKGGCQGKQGLNWCRYVKEKRITNVNGGEGIWQ